MKYAAAILGVLASLIASAHAFVTAYSSNGSPTRWNLTSFSSQSPPTNVVNRQTKAVRYFIASDTYSTANRIAEIQAIRNGFLQWQAVPNTILKFEEGGLISSSVDINTADKTNVVFWAKMTTLVNGQMDDIRNATGVTFLSVFADNTLAEADIVLNGVYYNWFTDYNNPVPNAQFVESVVLHEIGHYIGLDHSPLGGAAMFARGGFSATLQGELSDDEIAAARSLYGTSALANTLGRLAGQITMNGTGVLGATVILEDSTGLAIGGTLSHSTNGNYELPALPPGSYQVRVVPLDPQFVEGQRSLVSGIDIEFNRFVAAEINFLPTMNRPVALTAGKTTTLNMAVSPGSPAFRISRIRAPSGNLQGSFQVVDSAIDLSPGQSNQYVGVLSASLTDSDHKLSITGDGLIVGPAVFQTEAIPGKNMIALPVSVSASATPGLRTLIVQRGTDLAYVNGFLKIQARFPDINRDGFDDRFQRQYFGTPFATNAAATLDPDRDGFNNLAEYIAGSNPTDASSVLRLESIRWDAGGATIRWRSAAGKRYQVSRRASAAPVDGWQSIGSPIVSTGDTTEFLDATGTPNRLYRVEALP